MRSFPLSLSSSLVVLVMLCSSSGVAGPDNSSLTSTGSTPQIGEQIKNFSLKDYNGKEHSLYGVKGKKAVVVMFIATQCPVSNAYNERMVKIVNDYRDKGVEFVAINANKQESIEEIAKHSQSHNFNFPVLKDQNNVIADYFGAQVTPEIYVMDPNWVLRYHGRIDDSQKIEKVNSQDLRTALDAMVSGREVPKTETKAFGCTIKRVQNQNKA